MLCFFFFFQAEDGIRDLVRSRGLGDVYKRQEFTRPKYSSIILGLFPAASIMVGDFITIGILFPLILSSTCKIKYLSLIHI